MNERAATGSAAGRPGRTRRRAMPGWYLGRPYVVWRAALDLHPSPVTSCVATHADGSTTWSVHRLGGDGS